MRCASPAVSVPFRTTTFTSAALAAEGAAAALLELRVGDPLARVLCELVDVEELLLVRRAADGALLEPPPTEEITMISTTIPITTPPTISAVVLAGDPCLPLVRSPPRLAGA